MKGKKKKISSQKNKTGDFDGMLAISDGTTTYHMPVLVHVTNGAINTIQKDGTLTFGLDYPDSWSYAKISVIKKDSDQIQSTSVAPQQTSSLAVYEPGEYWIHAQITTPHGIDDAYDITMIKTSAEKTGIEFLWSFVPPKTIIIISGVIIAATIVGSVARRN